MSHARRQAARRAGADEARLRSPQAPAGPVWRLAQLPLLLLLAALVRWLYLRDEADAPTGDADER